MQSNVLLVVESLAHRGGTETQIFELISRVDSTRFRLHVCCFQKNDPPLRLPPPHRLEVLPLVRVGSLRAARQVLRLRRYIKRNRIDILETFLYKATVIGVLSAWGTPCRAIITARRDLDDSFSHHCRMTRLLNGRTTRILANSEAVKAKVMKSEKVAADKVDVLYNGVDLEHFSRPTRSDVAVRLGIPNGAPIVGIVANLRPVKDVAFFLEAAQQVAAAIPQAVFLIIGEGLLKPDLEALAKTLGIRQTVFFAGGLEDVSACVQRMRVGCLTSVSEGFSNAILEYMAASVPVVATAVGGVPEAVIHGKTGYLVGQRSVPELAGYVIALLRDEEHRRAMGREAYARCRDVFDIREAVRRHERYWAELLPQDHLLYCPESHHPG